MVATSRNERARALMQKAEEAGIRFSIAGDKLTATPKSRIGKTMGDKIGHLKHCIIAILRLRIAAESLEWRVDCPTFMIVSTAKTDGELAACLRCGGSWELHGSPAQGDWHIMDDPNLVESAAAKFVLASAYALIVRRNE